MLAKKFNRRVLSDSESGYGSGDSVASVEPDIYLSKPHLKFLNSQLQRLEPEDILKWALVTLPSLFQTTAFGLSGLVTIDMLSKLATPYESHIDLVFLDTLHHFSQTISLLERVRKRYPTINIHVYKPDGCETADDFRVRYGDRLWETNEELYDFAAKVEPAQRAYSDLLVRAVLTGRRRSQGGRRGDIDIVEVDENGIVKVNPLANWSYADVKNYIEKNNVPYNELLDQGYKSIGDWHSTQPVKEGASERSGRWSGRQKSECGIHNPKSRYAQFLMNMEQKKHLQQLNDELELNWALFS